MANPVIHFEISSKDTGKVRDFYTKLFGWPIDADNPMNYGIASTKDGELGIDGGLYEIQDPNDKPGLRIYAEVADAAACMAKVEALGGKVVNGPQEVPGMSILTAQFTDPEGNLLGVVQPLQS